MAASVIEEEQYVKGTNGGDDRGGGDGRSRSRHVNGILRSLRKPSYTLARGSEKIRAVNRSRLRRLLSRLVRRRNLKEASGVLSALLKGTGKEKSPVTNRAKYSCAMGLLKYLDGYSNISRGIQGLYEIWMKRIGSMKHWPLKERFLVRLEVILFCLGQGNVEDAHQAAICLMQEREFSDDSISNMVVGLTFCALWYSVIPEEFRSRVSDESYSSMGSKISGTKYNVSVENSEEHDAINSHANGSSFQYDSETSVRIDKDIACHANADENKEISMDVDEDLPKENFYVHSADTSDEENSSVSNQTDNLQYTYTFNGPSFESWLMPVQLSQSNEKLENFMSSHRGTLNDYYKDAIMHLRVALYSSPPVYEALLPLVQILLLGNYINEALNELEKFAHSSQTVLPLRAKANLLEHIDKGNFLKLSACYEDILKKDPTCRHSLAKLIIFHHRGEYDPQQLLEMIALHLEASYPESNIWKEYASCFIKICRWEEDRMSVCLGNNEGEMKNGDPVRFNTVPEIFTMGKSGKSWKLRCRWWLNRHFSKTILSSEIQAGDLQLLAYKAASASHMYGHEVEYVAKACVYLEDKDRDLFLVLQRHMQNCVGFYSNFSKNDK